MIRHRNIRTSACQIVTLCISLMAFMLMAGTVHAALSCNGCHDMPPQDSGGGRNPATGAIDGNHAGHSSSVRNACVTCHGAGVLAYSTTHSKYTSAALAVPRIKMAARIHNYSVPNGAARYSKGVLFSQSSAPVLGTCSNVNCHFEATTPTWGSANFVSPTDCNKCHGAPPSGGSTGEAGKHDKHYQYYPGADNCAKCHSNHTAETNKFAHATSAGHRNLAISFAAAPNNGSGAYSGPLNDYLPSQTNNISGSCTATYCHSPGNKASSFDVPGQVPTWGGSLPVNCTGCHKADSTSGSVITSGSHSAHIFAWGGMGPTLKCAKCHAATTTAGMTITDTSKHVNSRVDIAFNNTTSAANGFYNNSSAKPVKPYGKSPGSAYATCTNVYCHSTGQGNGGSWPPTYKTPTWGNTATGQCGTCHGINTRHGGTVFSIGSSTTLATGSHAKHLANGMGFNNSGIKCAACHSNVLTGGPEILISCQSNFCHSTQSKHTNYEINVGIPNLFGATATYNGTPKPGDGYSTCSNVSCHYNTTTPTWGTVTSINCFGCHSLAVLMASGSHSKHISNSLLPTMYNYTTNNSTAGEYNFGCSNCHPVDVANHMNGVVNVTLFRRGGVGSLRYKNRSTAVGGIGVPNSGITGITKSQVFCSAAYCHSNGDANNATRVYATTPNWYGGVFTGDRCANCHGNAPNSTIAGSKSHYNTKFLGYTSTTGGHQIGIHAMSIYSSPGGLAMAGTSGKSGHGNAGTATTISCNICHYATVTTARNDSNVVCKTCHVSGNTVGAQFGNLATVDRSKHVNGTVDIAFQPVNILSKAQMRMGSFNQSLYSSAWKRNVGYKTNGAYDSAKGALNTSTMWNSTTKTCSNVACHNGQSVKWSDNDGTTTCVSCHTAL